jgi:Mg2+ and Co2+ transporter CorA
VSQALTSLVNGTDTALALEDSVDDLTSSIWQYNLQNLSGEVLGFTQKMNQLKEQETLIRQVHHQAKAFLELQEQAQEISRRLEEMDAKAGESSKDIAEASEQTSSILAEIRKEEEAAKFSLTEVEGTKASVSAALKSSTEMTATMSSLVTESEKAREGINETKQNLASLMEKSSKQFEDINNRTNALLLKLQVDYDETAAAIKVGVEHISKELTDSITGLREVTEEELRRAALGLDNSVKQLSTEVSDLVTNTNGRLEAAEESHAKTLKQALDSFEKQADQKLDEVGADFSKKAAVVEAEARKSISDNDTELHRLTSELNALESRIRDSIERATGYTLFHSFQKRQEDLAKAKQFWAWALAAAVGVSLVASGTFIYSLRFVHVYDAAFYLKLSISLPIIYAIGFCSIQYSRERRLEEEYAFKSSISISLDPYQRLVRGLVDANKADELAKYTAFVIDSVNRVFTSPTEHIFDEHRSGKGSSPEKLLKGLRELLEPILAVVKK